MDTFIITCEHGGNRIPAPYRRLFRGQRALLDSHRGYDPGSLVMAKALASACRAPLVASTVSRLLIDLNRSIGHPQLFSAVTRAAPAQTRAQIVERYYRPHRVQVERFVGQQQLHLFEFRDGRIASYREYLDFGQVLLQLGVSPEGLHRALSKKLARTLTAADEGAA